MEQNLYDVIIGKDYPYPIVDIEATRKFASDEVWRFRKTDAVKKEGTRILKKHVNTSKVIRKKVNTNKKDS
jgi:deoxyribodipyrimidine photo-lyase